MTDVDVGAKIQTTWETGRRPLPYDRALDVLFAIAIAVHGPIDVLITTLAWLFESNPVVFELGVWLWVAIKVATLAVAALVWWDSTRDSPKPYPVLAAAWLGLLVGFGVALVFPNLAIVLAEVLGA